MNNISIYNPTQEELKTQVGKKKYYTQMSFEEIEGLWRRLKSIERWGVSPHAFRKVEERGLYVTYDDIVSIVDYSEIIDYKVKYVKFLNIYDERVCLRSKATLNYRFNLHGVFSLTTKRVISTWLNEINDRHATINLSVYDPTMKVFY